MHCVKTGSGWYALCKGCEENIDHLFVQGYFTKYLFVQFSFTKEGWSAGSSFAWYSLQRDLKSFDRDKGHKAPLGSFLPFYVQVFGSQGTRKSLMTNYPIQNRSHLRALLFYVITATKKSQRW